MVNIYHYFADTELTQPGECNLKQLPPGYLEHALGRSAVSTPSLVPMPAASTMAFTGPPSPTPHAAVQPAPPDIREDAQPSARRSTRTGAGLRYTRMTPSEFLNPRCCRVVNRSIHQRGCMFQELRHFRLLLQVALNQRIPSGK